MSKSLPIPFDELKDTPGISVWIQNINKSLDSGVFTPETSLTGSVTSSRGIYQRVGNLLFFYMELLGNLTINPATEYVLAPFQPKAQQDDITSTLFGANTILFSVFEGDVLQRGQINWGTNQIIPEATVTHATGLTVQGYYWLNN